MKMTTAYAKQLLKQLEEKREYLLFMEQDGCTYVAEWGGEPDTDYDYNETQKELEDIDSKIVKIMHAVNLSKITSRIRTGEQDMTADEISMRLQKLNSRKATLDKLRKIKGAQRHGRVTLDSGITVQGYKYSMVPLQDVQKDYARISKKIMEMELALERHNQLDEFEVNL